MSKKQESRKKAEKEEIKQVIRYAVDSIKESEIVKIYNAIEPFLSQFNSDEEITRNTLVIIGSEINEATKGIIQKMDAEKEHDVIVTGLSDLIGSEEIPGKRFQLQLHLVNVTNVNYVAPGTYKTGKFLQKPTEKSEQIVN